MILKAPSKYALGWKTRLSSWTQASVRIIASRSTTALIWVLAIAVLGLCLYRSVWVPVRTPVELPGGITPTTPELNKEVLQEISNQRTSRLRRERTDYSRQQTIFKPLRNQ